MVVHCADILGMRVATPNARPERRGAKGVRMQTGRAIPRPLQAVRWPSSLVFGCDLHEGLRVPIAEDPNVENPFGVEAPVVRDDVGCRAVEAVIKD